MTPKNFLSVFLTGAVMALMARGLTAQVAGSWRGELKVTPQMSLTVVFNIPDDGKATLNSPDQNAYGMPIEVLHNAADSVSLSAPSLGVTFTGRATGESLKGMFRQGSLMRHLSLTRSRKPEKPARPQTPVPPFPYAVEEVTIDIPADGARLAGSLVLPETAAEDTPVVLMVSGSGQQDRDETILDHRPFAVIADFLARRGIASLRLDDRGTGGSTGLTDTLTTAGNTADARTALGWLRGRLPGCRAGVLGHSEGGRIAFALHDAADFIVTLGAPAVRGDSILARQNHDLLVAQGQDPGFSAMYADALLRVAAGTDPDSLFPEAGTRSPDTQKITEAMRAVGAEFHKNSWIAHFLNDDPTADIRACRDVPLLALYGERDIQVSPEVNAPRLRALLPDADVQVLPGLNHLMQPCSTGLPTEYAVISTTMARQALDMIAAFILAD